MSEKIDWESLSRRVEVTVCKIITEELPEGIYACPRCEGTGRCQVGFADPGPNPTAKCGMCDGTQKIKKCKTCKKNPVPSNDTYGMCYECIDNYQKRILLMDKRPEIICNYPQLVSHCPTPDLQETNSNGNLVCDLELCDFASRKYGVYPAECIVKLTNGAEYCKTCVDREQCPWKETESEP